MIKNIVIKLSKAVAKDLLIRRPFYKWYISLKPGKFKRRLEIVDIQIQLWALSTSDSFTKEDWNYIQNEKLKNLLFWAVSSVPYWKRYLNVTEFFSFNNQALKYLYKIPVTSRGELKCIPLSNLITQNRITHRFSRATTSGSTGEPLRFYQDKLDIFRRKIGILRELEIFKLRINPPILILGLLTHHQLDFLGKRYTGEQMEDSDFRFRELYPFIQTYKPSLLFGTPTLLARFAEFVTIDKQSFKFAKIRYTGEAMLESIKARVAKCFSSSLFTQYGTRECSYVGMECEKGNLHLTPWINIVEILDDNGLPLPLGQEGNIVITYFENEVLPFIRYKIGDRGIIHFGQCPCNRSAPMIEARGRTAWALKTPSGTQVPLLALINKISVDFHDYFEQFQFLASGNTVTLRYKALRPMDVPKENEMLDCLNRQFKGETKISIEKVESLLADDSGKIPMIINK